MTFLAADSLFAHPEANPGACARILPTKSPSSRL